MPFVIITLAWRDIEDSNKVYFIFGASVLLGCITSYFVYTMRNMGLFIAGCFLGVVAGMEAYVQGIYRLEKEGSSLLLYLTIIILALAIGGLAIYLRK